MTTHPYELHAERDVGFFGDTASSHADELDWLVDRVRLLHWAVDTLAVHEFDIQQSNEWLWKFSDFAFRAILDDVKRASSSAKRLAGRSEPEPLDMTIEAMKTVQRAELLKAGMPADVVELRVEASVARVEAELDRMEGEAPVRRSA